VCDSQQTINFKAFEQIISKLPVLAALWNKKSRGKNEKILILCLIMILGYTLTAGASRMKVGISDYSPLLKEFSTKHGIYRFNGRFDLLNLSSRLGLGAAMNISFKK